MSNDGIKVRHTVAKLFCGFFAVVFLLSSIACSRDKHHVKFYLDEYDFVDKTLKNNLETVIAEQFKEEPDVPLDISFENPCGLLVGTLDFCKPTQRDSIVERYDIEIHTHHYEYYGYVEDSLSNWVEGCCKLAGHLCYIHPDEKYFKRTNRKQKIIFNTYGYTCLCMETSVCMKVLNDNGIKLIDEDAFPDFGGLARVTEESEVYDTLVNSKKAIRVWEIGYHEKKEQ